MSSEPHRAPSLLRQLSSMLRSSASGTLFLPREAAQALRLALREAAPSPALRDEIVELIDFSVFVGEQRHSPELARTLLDIACEATPVLERLAESQDRTLVEGRDRARTFLGEVGELPAPGSAEVPPEGSARPLDLRLSQLQRRR